MASVKFFSVPADDNERARKFYESVFGWRFHLGWEYETPQGRQAYWNIETGGGGIAGGMTRREFNGQPIGIGVEVEDIDRYLARVEHEGGRVAAPKGMIPGRAWFALCEDTEGNAFVVYQNIA
jgi:predicted enzyme related to lactoylglutathione lyase